MINAITVGTWCGKLYVELDEPVKTEEEALEIAIKIIRQSLDSAGICETFSNKSGKPEYSSPKQLDDYWKFIPQNDLEWLAVHVEKWNGHQYEGIVDDSLLSRVGIDNWSFTDVGHTREQWQNMRYYLGLDKKPHYEFINGQWSETK